MITGNTNLYQQQTLQQTLQQFGVNILQGLSAQQLETQYNQYGYNEVVEKKTPAILLFLKHFYGLTAWMLEATIAFSFILHKTFDGWLILALLLFNGIIGFVQEQKAARTVAALKEKLQVIVRVLRGATWQQVTARELAPGDVVRIRTGDFLAADMKLAEGGLKVDKSALTGESALLEAKPNDLLYAGSIVKNGECTAVVLATGAHTFFGKTTSLVMSAKHKLHMEEMVAKVVKILFSIVVIVLTATIVISLVRGESLLTIFPLILILLVSAVPVGLPAMFTISMARGSQELSKKGLLVSRLSATEDAATLTTLCIDKTGTITQNLLCLEEVVPTEQFSKQDVLLYGSLASVAADNDTIDLAFLKQAGKEKINISAYQQVSFKPFIAATKRTEAVIKNNLEEFTVMKGAYLTIKTICNLQQTKLDATVDAWAHRGFKTIAVAIQKNNQPQLAGIVALYDPPRTDSAEMIFAIKELGVDVKMLTGDALPVAKEIAAQTGVGNNIAAIADTRQQMQENRQDAGKIIHSYNGFAEVLPEDKFNIVTALQNEKQVVGMTGDGVNDAPALKQAEVGIAVKAATDVAKQAASIILLEEGLKQILDLIRVGRTIHVRITNYTVNKIAKTLQTILFVCVSYILTRQFVVGTMDMVLLLFLIDFVVLALATDNVQWSRQPASWNIKPMAVKGFTLGLLLFIECLVWFLAAKKYFTLTTIQEIHSLGFATLFYSGICAVCIIRSRGRFFKEPIGKTLLITIIADAVIVFALLSIGFTGFQKLPVMVTGATLLYFLLCNFILNDTVKLMVSKSK